MNRTKSSVALALGVAAFAIWNLTPARAQQGAPATGEWRVNGGDAGSTRYSPLDQINATNVKNLQVVWRWKAQNMGPAPQAAWEVTPLMAGGKLFFTAGTGRTVVAADAATGETLWTYRGDDTAERGAVRANNRGVSYWSDGSGDDRILFVTPGYQLVALNAKTGAPIANFGKDSSCRSLEGPRPARGPERDHRRDLAAHHHSRCCGGRRVSESRRRAAHEAEHAGLHSRLRRPHRQAAVDLPHRSAGRRIRGRNLGQRSDRGKDSWKFTGNTGAWGPLTGDEELGYVYIPVEAPSGDTYGGQRPGANLFSDSVVCLDAKTGKRIWYYQLIHHEMWDYDIPAAPILLDITVNGKKIKALAQVNKSAFTFVFDRTNGQPVWPIEETPAPQGNAPGEWYSPTQPYPTKPAAFDRQGVTEADLADYTPEIKAEALKVASQYVLGPIYTPPIVKDTGGKLATIQLPGAGGGANWMGGAVDPETGMLYVPSTTSPYISSLQFRAARVRRCPTSPAAGAANTNVDGDLAADQRTLRPHHGDQSQYRRPCLDDSQRQARGQHREQSGAEGRGHRRQQLGRRTALAHSGHEDAAVRRQRQPAIYRQEDRR